MGKGRNRDAQRPLNPMGDPRNRLQHWLQLHSGWIGVWLEGVDPPRRAISTPNVTALVFANMQGKKGASAGEKEFGFILTASRLGAKRKEREKECAKELVTMLDALPVEDMKAWCQLPVAGGPPPGAKLEGEGTFLDKLTALVRRRCPKVTLEMPEPSAFVMVAALAFPNSEKNHGSDPELPVLDKFDAGFGELLREARRVSGLVRKQWFITVLWAKPETKEELRPFALGVGMATDRELSRVRAMHAAEVRAQILTEAMFKRAVPQKALPETSAN